MRAQGIGALHDGARRCPSGFGEAVLLSHGGDWRKGLRQLISPHVGEMAGRPEGGRRNTASKGMAGLENACPSTESTRPVSPAFTRTTSPRRSERGARRREVDEDRLLADRLRSRRPGAHPRGRDGDFETFFDAAPAPIPRARSSRALSAASASKEVEEPTMRQIRYLDKLVDELAKGKSMDNIFRNA